MAGAGAHGSGASAPFRFSTAAVASMAVSTARPAAPLPPSLARWRWSQRIEPRIGRVAMAVGLRAELRMLQQRLRGGRIKTEGSGESWRRFSS